MIFGACGRARNRRISPRPWQWLSESQSTTSGAPRLPSTSSCCTRSHTSCSLMPQPRRFGNRGASASRATRWASSHEPLPNTSGQLPSSPFTNRVRRRNDVLPGTKRSDCPAAANKAASG